MTTPTPSRNARQLELRAELVEAVSKEDDHEVIFSALSHITGAVIFHYLFDVEGELYEENVEAAIDRFSAQLRKDALDALARYEATIG